MEKAGWPIASRFKGVPNRVDLTLMNLLLKTLTKAETLFNAEQNTRRTRCLKPLLSVKAVQISDHPVLITSSFSVNPIFRHSFFIGRSRSKHHTENIDKNCFKSILYRKIHRLYQTLTFLYLSGIRERFPGRAFFSLWHSCTKRRCRNRHLSSLCLPFLKLSELEDNSECLSTLLSAKFSVILYKLLRSLV